MIKNMKKIFFVSSKSDLSGAPLHVAQLATNFERAGCEIEIFYSGLGEAFENLPHTIKKWQLNGLNNKSSIKEFIDAVLHIKSRINAVKPDILHLHSTKAGLIGRISRVINKKNKPRCIFTVHGWGFGPNRTLLNSIISYTIEQALGRWCTEKYICVSNADKLLGIKLLKLSEDSICTIHNGIPDKEIEKKLEQINSKTNFIMVARVGYQKNHELLAKALTKVKLPWSLKLVGSGTNDEKFIKAFENWMGRENNGDISFMGQRNDIDKILSESDVFILASRFEGLPLSIIEAMRYKIPIIASDVGGVNEMIDGNGYLIPPNSDEVKNMIDAINKLCNQNLQKTMGEKSRIIYEEKFSEASMINKLQTIYEK